MKVKRFVCEELSPFVDSMLFDSVTNVAYGTFSEGGKELQVFLDVRGEVAVTYKDEVYHRPSEFPDELKALIRKAPDQWMNEPDVFVGLNNWFELIFDNNGEVFEENVSELTPDRILSDMICVAEDYFRRKE